MKFILTILFLLVPIICLAEDQSDNKTINKNLVININSECYYDYPCIIYKEDIQKALPSNFDNITLPDDLEITSFKSGNGINIEDYAINKEGIIYVMPSEKTYKQYHEEKYRDWTEYVMGGDHIFKKYSSKSFKTNENNDFEEFSDMIPTYIITKNHIIKGLIHNKIIITINLRVLWYFVVN